MLLIMMLWFFTRWLNPIFKTGYVRQLEVEDMYNVVQEDQSERLGDRLEQYVPILSFISLYEL